MVPLFFTTKTPMSYKRKDYSNDLCIIAVNKKLLCNDSVDIVITDGNLGSPKTAQYPGLGKPGDETLSKLDWDCIRAKFWTKHKDGSIKCAAEVLVHPYIAPFFFEFIIVKNDKSKQKAQDELDKCASPIKCLRQEHHFF